ncbi:hypothetical protein EA97_00274 [Enterococcus faecium]|nr:hypothetical protein EA97_00274 [Enterococcus faecium]
MIFLQKYGFYFLLLGVISDLSTGASIILCK